MSAERAIVSGLAGRYAVALFELAYEAKALDTVAADLDRLKGFLAEDADFARFTKSPLQKRGALVRAMAVVAETAGLSELTGRFLGVMAGNGRLRDLEDVIGAYGWLLAHHRGEISAEVASAHALSDAQMTALKAQLKKALGRDIAVEATVDASLLGGLVVKVGSRMIDSSLKTKLNNLKVAMKGIE